MTLQLVYVDDEPDLRELVSMAFELDDRIDVRCFDSGQAVLAAFETEALSADGILLDVMMPGMDGLETFSRLSSGPAAGIPVIFFTAHARPQERERLREAGAAGILSKPFDALSLAGEVIAILEQARS